MSIFNFCFLRTSTKVLLNFSVILRYFFTMSSGGDSQLISFTLFQMRAGDNDQQINCMWPYSDQTNFYKISITTLM